MRKEAAIRAEQSIIGSEPLPETDYQTNRLGLIIAYNWYNTTLDADLCLKYVLEYMDHRSYLERQKLAIKQAKSYEITYTMGANARLITRRCVLPANCEAGLKRSLDSLIKKYETKQTTEIQVSDTNKEKDQLIAKVEDIVDQFYNKNYSYFSPDIYNFLQKEQASSSNAIAIMNYYTPLLEELIDDSEGFEKLTIKQKQNYITFVQNIIKDAETYVKNKKTLTPRRPRKRKLKSAIQLSSKVKYKLEDKKLKLVSQPPANIIGSIAVWLYNTKYAKLTYLQAEPNSVLSIKGTTVYGYDTKASKTKKIRKPEKALGPLLDLGKVSMLKEFDKLKTKLQKTTGRINPDTIIVRIIK